MVSWRRIRDLTLHHRTAVLEPRPKISAGTSHDWQKIVRKFSPCFAIMDSELADDCAKLNFQLSKKTNRKITKKPLTFSAISQRDKFQVVHGMLRAVHWAFFLEKPRYYTHESALPRLHLLLCNTDVPRQVIRLNWLYSPCCGPWIPMNTQFSGC